MVELKTAWKVLTSPAAGYVAAGIALIAFLGYGAVALDSNGYDRADKACQLAGTKEQNELLATALQSAESAHKFTLAEFKRGEEISKKLATTQRKLDETKTEYLTFANGIVGNCPADLGRVLMSWPQNSGSEGAGKASPSGTPAHSSETVDAAPIAANIALNRANCERNFAEHSALLEWHNEGDPK
jgi:hypothetical protein